MSSGKAKRMLVHMKRDEEWNTMEFLSISDAMRSLRAEGVKFTDDEAFFNPDCFGTIVDNETLIEIEEACEEENSIRVFDKTYIPLSLWCSQNGISYESGKKMAYKKRLNAIKIGRMGRIFVSEEDKGMPYKDKAIVIDGQRCIPLSCWAKRNGMKYHNAVYLCSKGQLKTHKINNGKKNRIYILEDEKPWNAMT